MPAITAIKLQKNRKRANIYLDGKFGFGIDLENFAKLGLKTGQELADREIKEIVKKSEFRKILDKLLKFTTLRPRSEKEIRDWLIKKKVHVSLHNELFNRLNRLSLMNDEKFATWWVEQRLEFSPRGKKMIIHELRTKGVKEGVIKKVIEQIKTDEGKIAKELLDKKAYKWRNLSRLEARQKMGQFLARKGFDWEIIEKILKKR